MVREKCQTSMKSSSRQRRRVWLRRSSLITLGFQFCLILLGTTLRFFGYKHKKVKFVEVAVMLLKWAAILSAFVAASLGSVLPGKRSDFSMYDNQFSKWVSVFYFGVWPCTKPGKTQKVVMYTHTTNWKETLRCSSCIVYEHKRKDAQDTEGPSNINLSLFAGTGVYRASLSLLMASVDVYYRPTYIWVALCSVNFRSILPGINTIWRGNFLLIASIQFWKNNYWFRC